MINSNNQTNISNTIPPQPEKKKKQKKKWSKKKKVGVILGSLFTVGIATFLFLLYGPWPGFRNVKRFKRCIKRS